MVKLRRQETKYILNNGLERWLTFFDQNTPEEVLEEVIKMDSAIQKTVKKMDVVTSGEDFQHEYTLRIMALSDKITEINTAVEKRDIEIAKNALREGATIKFVQKITGLDFETVKKLKKQG
jgi:hypothetical protein